MAKAITHVRGDGRIFKHPKSRNWHMALWIDGKEHRRSTGETDERKALKRLRDWQAEVKSGEYAAQGLKITVGQIIELVRLDYEKKQNRSVKNLTWLTKHLLEHFAADMRAKNVTSIAVDAYIVARREEGAADSTIRQEVHVLDRGFKLAVTKRLLASQARPFIENITVGDSNARQGFVLRDEAEKIAAELCKGGPKGERSDYADFVLFLFHCTWRADEVRTLMWRDYDRRENAFRLRRENDKTKKGRLIPMAGELGPIIERRIAKRRLDCPYVFHRKGKPIGDIRKSLYAAVERVGLGHKLLHDLRRSGIGHLRSAGVSEQTIMRMSGHRTTATFTRYNIVSADDMRAALEAGAATTGDKSKVATTDQAAEGGAKS